MVTSVSMVEDRRARIADNILAARAALGNLFPDLRPGYLADPNRGGALRVAFEELERIGAEAGVLQKQNGPAA